MYCISCAKLCTASKGGNKPSMILLLRGLGFTAWTLRDGSRQLGGLWGWTSRSIHATDSFVNSVFMEVTETPIIFSAVLSYRFWGLVASVSPITHSYFLCSVCSEVMYSTLGVLLHYLRWNKEKPVNALILNLCAYGLLHHPASLKQDSKSVCY